MPNHRTILFITRVPPNSNGHGASQRAMHLLKSLSKIGTIDLVVIYRGGDQDVEASDLEQARSVAKSCTKVLLSDWTSPLTRWPWLPRKPGMLMELVTPYSGEAPRIPKRGLRALARAIPARRYDIVFAGRLPSATVVSRLLKHRLVEASRKLTDLDDIMSRFKERQVAVQGGSSGRLRRWLDRIEIRRIRDAERRTLREWDAVSVCTDDDVCLLLDAVPQACVVRVPNIVDKVRLPWPVKPGRRVLFVGSLAAGPNIQGLEWFLDGAWPLVRRAEPDAILDVVGMFPPPGLALRLERVNGRLHADVPSVEPFYRACDLVVSPINIGGGTRIKILEAMAYGRPVVSTTIGAEGLDLETGRHALIANEVLDFADAVVRLIRDIKLRRSLADAAHAHQRERFGPAALDAAVQAMTAHL